MFKSSRPSSSAEKAQLSSANSALSPPLVKDSSPVSSKSGSSAPSSTVSESTPSDSSALAVASTPPAEPEMTRPLSSARILSGLNVCHSEIENSNMPSCFSAFPFVPAQTVYSTLSPVSKLPSSPMHRSLSTPSTLTFALWLHFTGSMSSPFRDHSSQMSLSFSDVPTETFISTSSPALGSLGLLCHHFSGTSLLPYRLSQP